MNWPPLYAKPNETVRDSLKPLNSGFGGVQYPQGPQAQTLTNFSHFKDEMNFKAQKFPPATFEVHWKRYNEPTKAERDALDEFVGR